MNTLEATVLVQSSSNLLRMIILTMSQSSLNMGDCGSKTRSVGQIMEKHSEHSRGHSFGPIIIKLAQNDHLDNILVKFEYGSCWVKNKVSRSNHRKNLVNTLGATVLLQSSSNLLKMIILTISQLKSKMGHVRSKYRSVGQIFKNPCEHSRGHIFGPIIIRHAQKAHLDNISVKFEYWSCGD